MLRGGRGSAWEGAVRTPALVSSRRLFGSEGPRRVSGVMHASDWLPTLMEAANQSLAEEGEKTQGQSQWKYWTSNGAAARYKVLIKG